MVSVLSSLDWSAMRFGLDLLSTAAVFLLFIWTWIQRRQKDNSDDIKRLNDFCKKLDRRVQRLEDGHKHLPTYDDLTVIKVEVAGLTKQIEGMDNKLELIHQFLLNSKKGD